jgi:hypothetical protein
MSFAGADPGDFFVGSSTCGGQIAPGASCQITVRFAPQGLKHRSATLVIATTDPNGPAAVALTGTGAPAPPDRTSRVELLTCHPTTVTVTRGIGRRRHKVHVRAQQCVGTLISGTVKARTINASVRATLTRGRTVYATGASVRLGSSSDVLLGPVLPIRHGTYTLTLRSHQRGRWVVSRMPLTIT